MIQIQPQEKLDEVVRLVTPYMELSDITGVAFQDIRRGVDGRPHPTDVRRYWFSSKDMVVNVEYCNAFGSNMPWVDVNYLSRDPNHGFIKRFEYHGWQKSEDLEWVKAPIKDEWIKFDEPLVKVYEQKDETYGLPEDDAEIPQEELKKMILGLEIKTL